jgi:hypothetical protein
MSDIPADQPLADMNGAARPEDFWRRLAQTLDACFAERSKRAVPAITLRRSQHELAWCRRLMHRPNAAPSKLFSAAIRWPRRGPDHKVASRIFHWPPLRSICAFANGDRLALNQPKRARAASRTVNFPPRPDCGVLSDSIPLFLSDAIESDFG